MFVHFSLLGSPGAHNETLVDMSWSFCSDKSQ